MEDIAMVIFGVSDLSVGSNTSINKNLSTRVRKEVADCFSFELEPKAPAKTLKIGSAPGFKDDYDSLILKYAEEYELDPNIIKAIIMQESKFKPKLVAKGKGCSYMGLMQVCSRGRRNLLDPETNIRNGCELLRSSLDYFKGDIDKALMGYNRGCGGADKALRNGKNPQNDPYVKKVKGYYKQLTEGQPTLSVKG